MSKLKRYDCQGEGISYRLPRDYYAMGDHVDAKEALRIEAERDALAEKVVRLEAEKVAIGDWYQSVIPSSEVERVIKAAGEAAVTKHRKEQESK